MTSSKNYLIDMDGVLVSGSVMIPGADEFIVRLKERRVVPLTFSRGYSARPNAVRGMPGNGIFRSVDAGRIWRPDLAGLGQAAGEALTQIAGQPVVRTSRLASWALALSRWDRLLAPVRWGLILALSMLAAAWLWMVDQRRSLAPVVQKVGPR